MRWPIEEIEDATGTDSSNETHREYVERVLEQSATEFSSVEVETVHSIVEDDVEGWDDLAESDRRELAEVLERLGDTDGVHASGSGRRPRVPVATSNGGPEVGTDTHRAAPEHDDRSPYPRRRSSVHTAFRLGGVPVAVRRLRDATARLEVEEWGYLSSVVFAWMYIYLADLGGFDFRIYDETIYAHAARTTVSGGPWAIPHLYFNHWAEYTAIVGYQPFFLKPPLGIWLQSVSMTIFGPSKFAARFPSAVLMLVTACLLYVMARDVYDRHAAGVAAIVFLTVPQLFARHHGGRAAALEIPLLAFGTAFVYAAWRAVDREEPRWLLPMGLAGGLAVLTKGLGAGIFVLIVAPLVVVYWRRFWNASMLAAVGVTTVLVGSWTLYAYVTYGEHFVQVMIVDQVVERVTGSDVYVRDQPKTFSFMNYAYFRRFPFLAEPWAHFLVPAVLVAGVRAVRTTAARTRRDTLFLVWWIAIVFGFFAVTGNQPWYLIPVYVPLSMLVGSLASLALAGNRVARVGLVAGVASTLLLSGRLEGTVPTPWSRHDVLLDGGLPFLVAIVALPVVFSLAPTLRTVARERLSRDHDDVARLVVPALLVVVVTVTLAAPVALHEPYTAEQEQLGATATEEVPADAQLYAYDLGQTPIYAFLFAYDDGIESTDAAEINSGGETQYVLTEPDRLSSIRRSYTVLGTVAHAEYEKDNLTLIEVHGSGPGRSGRLGGTAREGASRVLSRTPDHVRTGPV